MAAGGWIIRRSASIIAIVGAALAGTSCGTDTAIRPTAHCALLPDSIGLYVGNPVTQMGYQIGTVDKISAGATAVRVDFTLSQPRDLPSDVRAVIRSTSVLADRALELAGNYDAGPKLAAGNCISLQNSVTPKSLSQIIGSANTFINGISPAQSQNISATIGQLNQALAGNGTRINDVLARTASLLDNPDAPIGDMGTIITNLSTLTSTLVQLRDPMKQILNDATVTTAYLRDGLAGARVFIEDLEPIVTMISDLEIHAGDELQLTLDAVADSVRIMSPHAQGIASLLDPLPWWINTAVNHVNNREFQLSYRPPLYRIRTPDGPAVCGAMNFSNPGSCAVVAGQPYGVDINLLQYVFLQAGR
jgi:virulence factor Mce-like protein